MSRTPFLAALSLCVLLLAARVRAQGVPEAQGHAQQGQQAPTAAPPRAVEPEPEHAPLEKPSARSVDDPDSRLAPPGYQAAAQRGLEAFDAGRYAEARQDFMEAHELWPNARSLRLLAHVEYELRNYVVAQRLIEESLASQVRALSDAQRKETEELLQKVRGYVAHYRIGTRPVDSRLLLDGEEVVRDAMGGVLLRVGHHVLEVQAPGYQPRKRELEVQGAVDQELLIELEPIREAPLVERETVDEPLRKKWWLWTSVGAVATAALITGLVVGLRDPDVEPPTGGSSGVVIRVPSSNP